ncbi:MAG: hypothetical protein KGL95_10040 [Patescibacteria group bacterium]|nr:hypothetical protein [Patescibacteria group bacterium]
MPICEQFIYTAAKIGLTEGYQVIAKSDGVSDEIIKKMSEYMYPIGVKTNEFKTSKSLIILDRKRIAYSIVKNIGVGYDGRRGTLYNHTFVIDKEEFEKSGNDSRTFDEHFIQNPSIRGTLPILKIEVFSKLPDLNSLKKLPDHTLKEILLALFKKSKIALVKTDDTELIQNLLSLLPSALRLIPFSTLVNEPDKQYKYDFIQIPERALNKLGKNFATIRPEMEITSSKDDDTVSESMQSLVEIVRNNDTSKLENMFKDFEKISKQLSQTKKIELKRIFDHKEFENMSQRKKFDKLKQKTQELYSDKTFTQATPRVIVSITKKLRKIVERALKRQRKSRNKKESDLNYLLSIAKILLDCMHYMRDYSPKHLSKSAKDEVSSEIKELEEIIRIYALPKTTEPYEFDVFQYMRMVYEETVKFWLLPFVILGRK